MSKTILNTGLRILLLTNALILLAGAMLGPIYALFVEEIGGDLMDASIAGGIFALVAGLTVLISGRCSDRIKHSERIVIAGYVLMTIGFASYMFVETIWQLFIVQIIIGLGEAIYAPVFDALYSRFQSSRHAGEVWGVWEAMSYFVGAIGAVLGGYIVTAYSFSVLFIIMVMVSFLSGVLMFFLPHSNK